MKILLVEDEKQLAAIIKKGLKKLTYAVDVASNGEEALAYLEINYYDLMILDLNLPKISGFDVLKKLRAYNKDLKVIILSARTLTEDKVKGLDLGANDYLEKPFDFFELSARIRNLLRWEFKNKESVIREGDLIIDTNTQKVYKKDVLIHLTNKEYSILHYLITNRERYVSTEEIIEHVWESDTDLFSNAFKFHLSSLKKKINIENIIQNKRGIGYKFGSD